MLLHGIQSNDTKLLPNVFLSHLKIIILQITMCNFVSPKIIINIIVICVTNQTTADASAPDLIGSVEDADDLEEHDGPGCELDDLPRLTGLVAAIHDHVPVPSVDRRVNEVAVGALIAVPEQQPGAEQATGLQGRSVWKFPINNRDILINNMIC